MATDTKRVITTADIRKEAGLFNSIEAAGYLNIPERQFFSLQKRGSVPKPTRKMVGSRKRFYSKADLTKIIDSFA